MSFKKAGRKQGGGVPGLGRRWICRAVEPGRPLRGKKKTEWSLAGEFVNLQKKRNGDGVLT